MPETQKMKNRVPYSKLLACVALLALAAVLPSPAALATGTLGVDAATLNELLPALTAEEFEVAVVADQTFTLQLEELEVTGFDPSAGGGSTGQILTRVRVAILDLGVTATIHPRLALSVVERKEETLLVLRFEEAEVPLPLLGEVDIGMLIPPLEFPAESLFVLQGAGGDVPMRGWLTGVKMGQRVLQFEFELKRESK